MAHQIIVAARVKDVNPVSWKLSAEVALDNARFAQLVPLSQLIQLFWRQVLHRHPLLALLTQTVHIVNSIGTFLAEGGRPRKEKLCEVMTWCRSEIYSTHLGWARSTFSTLSHWITSYLLHSSVKRKGQPAVEKKATTAQTCFGLFLSPKSSSSSNSKSDNSNISIK